MIEKRRLYLFQTCLLLSLLLGNLFAVAQVNERPFIWVNQNEKAAILNKIETQAWAKSFFQEFKERLDTDILLYKKSPENFLNNIPFDWSKQTKGKIPPLKTFEDSYDFNLQDRNLQNTYLQIGIDCGVMYFLTDNEWYAQCATDILFSYVEALLQTTPSAAIGNGGWLYPTDHLREARIIGAQLPIIYDFVATYIQKNNKAFDIGKKDYAHFSTENAQKVFLTYAKLAVERGQTGSNWSVLESFSLVNNALALNDLSLRNTYLDYYLVKGTKQQDALPDISQNYKNEGDVYPETSQYSNGVAEFTTRLFYVLNRYNPSLKLGLKHYKIPFSLDKWNNVRYPNNDIIRFGDGHRYFDISYDAYEMAYLLGKQDGVSKLTEKFGPIINKGILDGSYSREKVGRRSAGITVYFKPTELLWLNEIDADPNHEKPLPRTDVLDHAGVFLQRNVTNTNSKEYGLMSFVGGAQMVHGHANGMDMELYGLGEVLGVDHGRGSYRTDLHENYSRLFAAHNTVIVNGASQGEGDWVNLGINKVQLIAMEPMPLEPALSPNFSFTRTSFLDDRGDKAEATQERTMALIRTSPTTGYYMDVFRSKSALPNEYHDYLYHNIGDNLKFLNTDMNLQPDEDRFQSNANGEYHYNRTYRNPGWHFFKEITTSSNYKLDVTATFEINKLKAYMNVFVLGNSHRDYTKVMAPKTFEAPKPYLDVPTPTLVLRQRGEAWTNPFAVIYEPTFAKDTNNGITAVSKLEDKGVFKGFKVESNINNTDIIQYIVNQAPDDVYENKDIKLYFKGAFAIITFNKNNNLESVYIGEGETLKLKEVSVQSKNTKKMASYIDFSNKENVIKATENASVKISAQN